MSDSMIPAEEALAILNRRQLLGCVCAPYDLGEPSPEDFDLQDVHCWEEEA